MSERCKRRLKDLRVTELKAQLEKRGLATSGVKAVLTERLKKHLEDVEGVFVGEEEEIDFDATARTKEEDSNGGNAQPEDDAIHLMIEDDEENLFAEETPKATSDDVRQEDDPRQEVEKPALTEEGSPSSPMKKTTDECDSSRGQEDVGKKGGRNLWVSGLASTIRATDLKKAFSEHGKVIGAKVVTNTRSPGARCYGYITMGSSEEASNCISALHRSELHNRVIFVERARTGESGPPKKEEQRKPQRSPATGGGVKRGPRHRSPPGSRREEEARRYRRMEDERRESERRRRCEEERFERERLELRREREKIEREKAELLKLERERQRFERERLQREKEELERLRWENSRLEDARRPPMKGGMRGSYYDERKMMSSNNRYNNNYRGSEPQAPTPRYDSSSRRSEESRVSSSGRAPHRHFPSNNSSAWHSSSGGSKSGSSNDWNTSSSRGGSQPNIPRPPILTGISMGINSYPGGFNANSGFPPASNGSDDRYDAYKGPQKQRY